MQGDESSEEIELPDNNDPQEATFERLEFFKNEVMRFKTKD